MKTLKINIGLNNNTLDEEKIIKEIFKSNIFEFLLFQKKRGEYLHQVNKYEPTLIVEGETKQTPEQIEKYIVNLCTLTNQDCIPFSFADLLSKEKDQTNKLVYNVAFKGFKHKFDENYFLTIGNTDSDYFLAIGNK